MGLIVFVVFVLPVIIVVIGGLLIRGQGTVRGTRYWVGIGLMLTGAIAFVWLQLNVVFF